jgi:hypothetical protein
MRLYIAVLGLVLFAKRKMPKNIKRSDCKMYREWRILEFLKGSWDLDQKGEVLEGIRKLNSYRVTKKYLTTGNDCHNRNKVTSQLLELHCQG